MNEEVKKVLMALGGHFASGGSRQPRLNESACSWAEYEIRKIIEQDSLGRILFEEQCAVDNGEGWPI